MPPIIAYHTKYARRDWWLFAIYVVAAGAACAVLGFAMERDEARAARSRAEFVAGTLAERFALAGATPGSDYAATLTPLAAAGAPDLKFAVVEGEKAGRFAYDVRGRYLGHSEPVHAGKALDTREESDRRTLDLVTLARERGPGHAVLVWSRGAVSAAAVAPNTSVTAIVEGLHPRTLSKRPRTVALVAFVILVVFAAGLHDVLPRIGRYLNVPVLLAGVAVVGLLGAALEPSLWRGATDDLLIRRAEMLRLSDLSRVLSQDLPAPASDVLRWGAKAAAAACALYLIALTGVVRRASRSVSREVLAYRFAAPALGLVILFGAGPLVASVALSLFRATPADRSFAGLANFTAFAFAERANPTSFWRVIIVNLGFVAASALLQLGGAGLLLLVGLLIEQRRRWLYRMALFLPWALPSYVAALASVHVLHLSAVVRHLPVGWWQSTVGAFIANVLVSAWIGAPMLAVLGLAAVELLPHEAVESLRFEGVRGWGFARYVALPFLRPLLGRALLLCLLSAFNAFSVVDLVSGGGPDGATDLLVTRAYRWAFERYEFGHSAAWSIVALCTLWATFAAFRRGLRRAPSAETAPAPESDVVGWVTE